MNKVYHIFIFLLINAIFAALPSMSQVHPTTVSSIVVKVKPEFRDKCLPDAIAIDGVQTLLHNDERLTGVSKIFPRHEPLKIDQDRYGQRLVDLSLIYYFDIAPGTDAYQLCAELMRHQWFEYAEPHFEYPLLYNPNDPIADSVTGYQWQLHNIRAYQAWNVSKGDSSKVIGIIDTGTKFDHADLLNSVKYNLNDPVDGIDNDMDGYVDNFRGYDLADGDNNPSYTTDAHGVMVSGAASATADNDTLLAGPGFHCKYLPVKVYGNNFRGYEGIVYAADQGVASINLSWGTHFFGYQQFEQDVINYAVINKDIPVIAAGGNTSAELDFYPASYDNVISVAISDVNDELPASNATYTTNIDMQAPGYNIISTWRTGGIINGKGSSYASPMVAATVAIVSHHFPSYNAQQRMEQVRVSADKVDTLAANQPYKDKLGKGRLNMYRALTLSSPSVRKTAHQMSDLSGAAVYAGDTGHISFDFINYLSPTSALEMTLTCSSPYITMIDSVYHAGTIGTMQVHDNHGSPFVFAVSPSAPADTEVLFRLGFEDGSYEDFQFQRELINPSFFDIDINRLLATVPSNGRIGFADDQNKNGSGIQYEAEAVLFEGGLMIGLNADTVVDCIRYDGTSRVQDFTSFGYAGYVNSAVAEQEVANRFHDTLSPTPVSLSVSQRSFAWAVDSLEDFVIVEYELTNISGKTLDSIYVGLFMDYDIGNYQRNAVNWEADRQLGYAFNIDDQDLYTGIRLLTRQDAGFYALDLSNTTANNNIYLGDNFSKAEKFQSLSSGVAREQAGVAGNDIAMVYSGKVTDLQDGETATVTFGLLGANSLEQLEHSADKAVEAYRISKSGPTPVASDVNACRGTANQSVTPSNGQDFRFYTDPEQTELIHQGADYQIPMMDSSYTLYVTNHDSALFESYPAMVQINAIDDFAAIGTDRDTVYYELDSTLQVFNLSPNASSQFWDLGNGSTSTQVDPITHYDSAGTYTLSLFTTDVYGCTDSAQYEIFVRPGEPVPLPLELLSFTGRAEGEHVRLQWITADEILVSHFELEKSADANRWRQIARTEARNMAGPNIYSFYDRERWEQDRAYYRLRSVDLDNSVSYSEVVTIGGDIDRNIVIYPNPASETVTVSATGGTITSITIYDAVGSRVLAIDGNHSGRQVLQVSSLTKGLYLLLIQSGDRSYTERLMVK